VLRVLHLPEEPADLQIVDRRLRRGPLCMVASGLMLIRVV
jgi:hypothetical protein